MSRCRSVRDGLDDLVSRMVHAVADPGGVSGVRERYEQQGALSVLSR
mgnify:CR=1 FL=1